MIASSGGSVGNLPGVSYYEFDPNAIKLIIRSGLAKYLGDALMSQSPNKRAERCLSSSWVKFMLWKEQC